MKKLIVLSLLLLCSDFASAQKFKEWFRQKKTQKQYLLEQIALLKTYLELTEKGYKIAKQGLTTIGDIKNGEFKLHRNRFDSLSIVKPVISKNNVTYAAAYQIFWTIMLYYQFEDILNEDEWLTTEERKHYKSVFDQAAWDAVDLSDHLDIVVKDGKFSMTDDARIQRVNELYHQSQAIYSFVRQICSEAMTLSNQRKSEKENIGNSRVLHGIN